MTIPAKSLSAHMSINDIIKKFPSTIGVFNAFNIDSCCGGARSLEQSASEDGVDLDRLLDALLRAARDTGRSP